MTQPGPIAGQVSTPETHETREPGGLDRRKFLTYLVAAPTLAIAVDLSLPQQAAAVVPTLPAPADILDLGDLLILTVAPTVNMIVVEIGKDGHAHFELPKMEVGQGLTTAIAMLIAEELDLPLSDVDVTLADARPEILWAQLTGGSNSIRSLYGPVRAAAAMARARLLQAASVELKVDVGLLKIEAGVIVAPDGRVLPYGVLTTLAAGLAVPPVLAKLKDEKDFKLVGKPTDRIDARKMVTGQLQYTMDLDVPGAMPVLVRRAPNINGTPKSIENAAAVKAMPGIIDVQKIPTGVAVMAETFGQALDGKNALEVIWNDGTVDNEDNASIRKKLRAATLPLIAQGLLTERVDAEFDFAFTSHAPMETNCAIADVREDSAEVWSGLKSPIVAGQKIALQLGLRPSKVKVHVTQSGGSFGRRLFWDGALEAAHASKAFGKPVKLMWTRIDDTRHGRARAASFHRLRATHSAGQVLTFEHRVASVETDWGHGFGEILSNTVAELPIAGNATFAETVFLLTVKSPYNFGLTTQLLTEVPLKMHTGAYRSVYSANTRGAEEILVDELALAMKKDPVAFRREFLKTKRQRAVLDKVATAGDWGKDLPDGFAQGVGFHEEYKSCTACLVELDARDPKNPRVTKATIAVDVGRPVNPRGLESQMLGGLSDAISNTFTAGLHIVDGLPLEGSYSQFHYARQKDQPMEVEVIVMPPNGEPGGAGELGMPAPVGAIANAYRRATGIKPRSFPLNFPVDFEPFPR